MGGYLRFPNINSVTISGRLTRDIELKYSANNLPIASMCIAVSHYSKDEAGNTKEETSFVDTVAFGRTAQICQESLKKGSPLLVEGYLKTRTWTDQNQVNRKQTEILINRVYPLEREEGYVPRQNSGFNSPPPPIPPDEHQYQTYDQPPFIDTTVQTKDDGVPF